MMTFKVITTGKLTGAIYDFPEIGDVLPMHSHSDADNHISIVAMGSFRVHSTSGWEATAYAGEVLDWQPNDPHEFVALESGSKLVNIVK